MGWDNHQERKVPRVHKAMRWQPHSASGLSGFHSQGNWFGMRLYISPRIIIGFNGPFKLLKKYPGKIPPDDLFFILRNAHTSSTGSISACGAILDWVIHLKSDRVLCHKFNVECQFQSKTVRLGPGQLEGASWFHCSGCSNF